MKNLTFVILVLLTSITLGNVLVSIPTLKLIAQEVVADLFEVKVIVQNANPHLYQLKISDVEDMAEADLILLSGVEDWCDRVEKLFPSKTLVFNESFLEEPFETDKHLWLDPLYAVAFSYMVYSNLEELVSDEHKEILKANLSDFVAKTLELTRRIYDALEPVRGKTVVELHPALTHFAMRFGLGQVIALQTGHEEGLIPSKLTHLSRLARQGDVQCIFLDKVIQSEAAKSIAEQMNLKIIWIDVTGAEADSYSSYIENLAKALLEGLKNTHH